MEESIYLLSGKEKFLLETYIRKIKKSFGEIVKGINYILLDEQSVDKLIPNIETPAFGYPKKLIVIKPSGLFKKVSKKKNAGNTELFAKKISEYIKENIEVIKENVVIIFIEEEIEKNELYNTIEKYGKIQEFKQMQLGETIKLLKNLCEKYNVKIQDGTIRYLVEVSGSNIDDLINEIRKLIEYVGENETIEKEMIDKLCIKQIESKIFDLTDNLGTKQLKKAINEFNALLYNKEPIQKILITLYNHFKKLYLTKIAVYETVDVGEALNLKPNQMFLISKYKKQASYFEEENIKKILGDLIELDYNSKIGLIDLQVGLEAILCAHCK